MHRVDTVEFTEFEWDERKRQLTIDKSGVDFAVIAPWLLKAHLESPSRRSDEPRIQAICGSQGRTVIIVYVIREDRCRIISAWPADRNEQGEYRPIFGG